MINEFLVNLLFAKIFVIGENEPHGRVVAGVNCHDTNIQRFTQKLSLNLRDFHCEFENHLYCIIEL